MLDVAGATGILAFMRTVLHTLRGVAASAALGLNVIVGFTLMMPFALAKLAIGAGPVRRTCDRALNAIATGWIAVNDAIMAAVGRTRWDVSGTEGLSPRGWYLVCPNHRSWTDILVLQKVFRGRIPFLKFFLKAELIWVPVIGLAWWALDFPFLKRGAGGGRSDIETTRRACEKFRTIPTSVINFVEGTRFTRAKHDAQRSPYRHLLKPKAGGVAIALATMGEDFTSLLDVTIAYPRGTPTFWDLLCGRMEEVVVRVDERPIPRELLGRDPTGDAAFRAAAGAWLASIWEEKDRTLDAILGAGVEAVAPA
ncbi:MAG TPA: acyltransferase [Casimicrobiaceae bacterium]|nr:acyltransferase [Casimicrobiaceae bacterium]